MGCAKLLLLLLVCAAVCVGTSTCWGDDVVEDAKSKAEGAKQFASQKIESWDDWAHPNFDVEKDTKQAAQNMKHNAEDAASRATETMKSAASGTSEYASEKAADAKEAISGAMSYGREKASKAYDGDDEIIKMTTDKITDARDSMGETMNHARERMGDTYEDAKQKMYMASDKASTMANNAKDNMASNMASENFNNAKDTMADAMGYAKDKASDAYDEARYKINNMASGNAYYDEAKQKVKGAIEYGKDKAGGAYDEAKEQILNMSGDNKAYDAKHEVGDACMSAKNTMTEEAKAKYEAAKEKASEATGDVGAKMRNSQQL